MEILRQKFYEKYAGTSDSGIRNFVNSIDWNDRLIGIKGSRGVGKTTMLLQYIKLNFQADETVLYVSLDDFYFLEERLYNLAAEFYRKGGKLLVLDEVHRYPEWAGEIKNIYDDIPGLKLVFTGSSLLHLRQAKADLSRRAVMYEMPGLSLREFINFETGNKIESYSLEDILNNHVKIAMELTGNVKPLAYFDKYLNHGYYPFYLENLHSFHNKLSEVISTVLEIDIPQFENIPSANLIYLKRLLKIISGSVPFKPNMNTLSERTGISLNTMKNYLKNLYDANLISLLYTPEKGMSSLGKPEKIFLENSNLMINLSGENANYGNLRETFFFNQLKANHKVFASTFVDFLVDEIYNFEIGGKNKTKKQISNNENAWVVKDGIEIGSSNIIPLWLFGFLY